LARFEDPVNIGEGGRGGHEEWKMTSGKKSAQASAVAEEVRRGHVFFSRRYSELVEGDSNAPPDEGC